LRHFGAAFLLKNSPRNHISGETTLFAGKLKIMETLILTIHILIALGLVITVLLQRSEGGGLGIGGGGGGGGGFMTARGTANLLTRLTTILAVGFFTTTVTLAIMAGAGKEPVSIVDDVIKEAPTETSGPTVPTGQ
jgi:preprotein translocase subunit SecG